MKENIDKFLRILEVELLDLEEDLVTLEDNTRHKWEDDEISNYVFLENMAILRKEMSGIQKVISNLKTIDSSTHTNLDQFIDHVLHEIKTNINNIDLPEGVYRLLQRKMEKVSKFILE